MEPTELERLKKDPMVQKALNRLRECSPEEVLGLFEEIRANATPSQVVNVFATDKLAVGVDEAVSIVVRPASVSATAAVGTPTVIVEMAQQEPTTAVFAIAVLYAAAQGITLGRAAAEHNVDAVLAVLRELLAFFLGLKL